MRPSMLGNASCGDCTVSCMMQVFHSPVKVDKPPREPARLFIRCPDPNFSFGKDTGLQVRMALTFFLLGLLYVVFGAVLSRRSRAPCR